MCACAMCNTQRGRRNILTSGEIEYLEIIEDSPLPVTDARPGLPGIKENDWILGED